MATNHFTDVIAEVQKAPQNQRTDKLIEGIAQQMQQSGNAQLQQFGQELATARPQLVRACQQQQG
jgi:glycyl-tRNA synthetase (class II)